MTDDLDATYEDCYIDFMNSLDRLTLATQLLATLVGLSLMEDKISTNYLHFDWTSRFSTIPMNQKWNP